MANETYIFRNTLNDKSAIKGDKLFRKDLMKVGEYYANSPDGSGKVKFEATRERLDQWANQFNVMNANGVSVDLVEDHRSKAQREMEIELGASSKRGQVTNIYRDDDTLYMDVELPDDESVSLINRCPEVSIEVEPTYTDGKGRVYSESITAVAVCREPVVPDQGKFVPISASRQGNKGKSRTATGLLMSLSANSKHIEDDQNKPNHGANEMWNKEEVAKARKALKISDDVTDEKMLENILIGLGKEDKSVDLQKQIDDLTKSNGTLTSQNKSLSKGGAPEIDVDLLESQADNTQLRLDKAIADGHITPALSDKLAASLIGSAGSRNKICLSQAAATHAGLPLPFARTIIDDICAAIPKGTFNQTGEKTGIQALSRQSVQQTEDEAGAQSAVDRMVKSSDTGTGVL